jgi:hypothetical protein
MRVAFLNDFSTGYLAAKGAPLRGYAEITTSSTLRCHDSDENPIVQSKRTPHASALAVLSQGCVVLRSAFHGGREDRTQGYEFFIHKVSSPLE